MTSPGKPESKSLTVTAPISVPIAGTPSIAASSEGGCDRGSKMMQRPAPFDGSSTWEAYWTQFGLLAGLNKWTEQEKAAYLAISLRGSALTILTNIPEGQRSDYGGLCGRKHPSS